MPEEKTVSESELRILCASSLFDGYAPLELAAVLGQFGLRRRVFSSGEILADETLPAVHLAVVLDGFVHLYDTAFKGERHLVRVAGPGEVVGATIVSARSGKTYPTLVKAFGPGVLATFVLASVRAVQRSGQERRFFDNLGAVVGEQVQALWRTKALLSCSSIADRVLLYLKERRARVSTRAIDIGMTEAAFADFLGVHRTALVRVLKNLVRDGRLTYHRNFFTLREDEGRVV